MLKDIVDELPIHVFNADEREKEYHELYGITNEIFTEVMKERKLKKLKIDKGDDKNLIIHFDSGTAVLD